MFEHESEDTVRLTGPDNTSAMPLSWTAHLFAQTYGEQHGEYVTHPGVHHDPLSIGVSVLIGLGYGGAISGLGATLLGAAIIGAGVLAVGALATLFIPKTLAEDRQQVLRQTFGPRVRSYGRVKAGGNLWFFESKEGTLYVGQTLNHGEISAIQEIWLNDTQVTLDGSGFVNEEPWNRDGDPVVSIKFKQGAAAQTVFADLDAAFTQVTSAHKLQGYAHLLAQFEEVEQEEISEVYGTGNPTVRVVMDASKIEDVRTAVVAWSDNPANAIFDYLVGVDEADFPVGAGFDESWVNRDSFEGFGDLSDELVDLKAGGTIKRYRLWGSYGLDEEVVSVLRRMLDTCDGDLFIDTEGKIAIRGGQFVTPTLTLDESSIISAEFVQGAQESASFNELTISCTEPTLDYSTTEVEMWVDTANVALRGEVLTDDLQLPMVPHHAQARRLAKIHTAKRNPQWSGTLVTNFNGFNAIGEEMVTVVFPILGINGTLLVQKIEILDDLTGCRISVSTLNASAYDWDEVTEEGEPPPDPPDTTGDDGLDPPADFTGSIETRPAIGGGVAYYIVAEWTPPARDTLSHRVQYRPSSGGPWTDMFVDEAGGTAESLLITIEENYELQIQTLSPAGVGGPWGTFTVSFFVERPQIFLASGTYTPHANMLYCDIEVQAAGGGGGGCAASTAGTINGSGGGGGGGFAAVKGVSKATIGASQVVTIGAVGTGGAAGANNGVAGASASVGALCVAAGGGLGNGAGAGGGGSGGAGGAITTGDYGATGKRGENGVIASVTTFVPRVAWGGDAHMGAGGGGQTVGTAAIAGKNYGGGGSGVGSNNASAAQAGGDGGAGIIIITEYCSA